MNLTKLKEQNLDPNFLRRGLPNKPGVYLFKDKSSRVIYVGKAKDIKKRVMSYFRPPLDLPIKTALMIKKAKSLDYILTSTENEAFILESSLIKSHMPRYNVILRDDKQYPCLRLSIQDRYPRLNIVRKIKKDGALYFGPFSSTLSVRSTLKLIDRIFRMRKCRDRSLPSRPRPCLNYQLDRCLGPCSHDVPIAEYRDIVGQVKLFLEGRNRELIVQLKKEMKKASDLLDFEEAARIRDQIRAVEKTIERQYVISPRIEDLDIIALANKTGIFQIVIMFIRHGYLLGSRNYLIKDKIGSSSEVMESFIKQHYHKEKFIPNQILISEPIGDIGSIKNWLSELAEKKISIHHPIKGEKLRLIKMALSNANNLLMGRIMHESIDLMEMSKSLLHLTKAPSTIEGLDISNLHGGTAVGSIVSFRDGIPLKSDYRNYKIKSFDSIDDYGMMAEMVNRRLEKGNLPDLFLVDGGKGHLMAVIKALKAISKKSRPDVIAIAKSHEHGSDKTDKIFLPGRKNPLLLKNDNPVLLLLMRIRDEAHRRAISYHRKLRDKKIKASILDSIPGIGPKRKRLLLKQFGDINAIATAKIEELEQIPGINNDLAKNILSFL